MGSTWNENEWVDIGGGVRITSMTDDETGTQVGIMERHTCEGGRDSRGYIPFNLGESGRFAGTSRWTVEQEEPLTLSPSIACRHCSNHGWIRNGRWEAA